MPETLRTINPRDMSELEHDDNSAEQDGAPEQLVQLQAAAEGAESVLETAILNGEPRSDVVETDAGLKGFVSSSVPGGRVEALFDGTGDGSRLEKIDIALEDQGNGEHTIGIKFDRSGRAELFVDGIAATPAEIPAVAAIVDHIENFQRELADKAAEQEAIAEDEDARDQ